MAEPEIVTATESQAAPTPAPDATVNPPSASSASAASVTPAAKGDRTTALDASDAPAPADGATPATPADWRALAAGDNADLKKVAERYATPGDVLKALTEAQKKIASGAHKKPPAAGATPEEIAEYRKTNGVPAAPTDYKADLPNGLILGTNDKPYLEQFAAYVHGKNWSQEQFSTALEWWAESRQADADKRYAADEEDRIRTTVDLRTTMGPELVVYQNGAKNMLAGAPEGLREQLHAARLPDGMLLGNHPDFVKWMGGLARELNPAATLVPSGTENAPKAIEAEIASIRAMIATDRQRYEREGHDVRLAKLLDARDKMKSRAA